MRVVNCLLFENHVLRDQLSVDRVCPIPISFDLLDHALEHLLQQVLLNCLPLECHGNVVQDLGSLILGPLHGGGRQHTDGALERWLLPLQQLARI